VVTKVGVDVDFVEEEEDGAEVVGTMVGSEEVVVEVEAEEDEVVVLVIIPITKRG